MARSYSNAKALSAFITNNISLRSYAAASQSSGRSKVMLKKVSGSEETVKISWVPDPVTGYYRPETHAKEVDAVELREMIKNKTPRN